MTAHKPDAKHPRFTYPAPAETESPANQERGHEQGQGHGQRQGHGQGGHGLMMLLMCLPMFLIVGFVVLTGAAGSGAFLGALVCMGMLLLMIYAMPSGHGHK